MSSAIKYGLAKQQIQPYLVFDERFHRRGLSCSGSFGISIEMPRRLVRVALKTVTNSGLSLNQCQITSLLVCASTSLGTERTVVCSGSGSCIFSHTNCLSEYADFSNFDFL